MDNIPANAYFVLEAGKIYPLDKSIVTIGRSLENQLVLDHPSVSRYHAQLRAWHDQYVLFDLSSRAGTFINGQRIQQAELHPGDLICIAEICFTYQQDHQPQRPDLKETLQGLVSWSHVRPGQF
jgi:pSer/pThr/pTyr-binding forkhead associated (FHA) protein